MTESKPISSRIPSLDVARAIAILWVILLHMHGSGFLVGISNKWFRDFAAAGDAGVDLFFVLSGYLIASIALKESLQSGSINVTRFWFRRWMRTLPAYYCVLLLMWAGDNFYQAKGSWEPRWSFLVFLQTSLISFENMRFAWSWSLCVEELFYFLFPLLTVAFLRSIGRSPEFVVRSIAVTAVLLSVVVRAMLSSRGYIGGHTPGYAIPICRLDGIGVGLFIATIKPIQSYSKALILLLASLVCCSVYVWNDSSFWWLKVHRFLPLSISFGVLIYSLVSKTSLRKINFPGAAAVSAISYSCYLIHPIIAVLMPKLVPSWSPLAAGSLFLVLSVIVSVLMRYGVELPGLWIRDHFKFREHTKGLLARDRATLLHTERQKNLVIESLRGIAALFVVFFHYFGLLTVLNMPKGAVSNWVCHIASFGHYGVPVFFLISGYVIYLTASRIEFNRLGTQQFLLRRLVRIVPPYWIMLVTIVIVVFLGKGVGFFRTNEVGLGQILSHFFYLQEILGFAPLDVAFWTLCIEIQFYLFFCVLMICGQKLGSESTNWLIAISVIFCIGVQLLGTIPNWLFVKHWPIFALGSLICMLKTRGFDFMILALSGTILAWTATHSAFETVLLSTVAALILSQVYSQPRPLLFLGSISYSLYLVHGLVGAVLAGLMKKFQFPNEFQNLGFVCFFVLFAIALASVFSKVVEKPAIELSRRLGRNQAAPAAAVVTERSNG